MDQSTLVGQAGFFRVGQDAQGRWWFVTPDDKPFFYRGVCAVNRAGTAGGRRAVDGEYANAVDAAYPDRKSFAEAQVRRLREWGFNALGAWSTEEFYDLDVDGHAMPYTEILEFGYVGPQIVGPNIWLPDVFDPAWEKAADEWAEKICTPRKQSRALVGYFTDNELTWSQFKEEDLAQQADPDAVKKAGQVLLLQHALSLPETSGTFQEAWRFVTARYKNDLAALSRAWKTQITGPDSLRKLNPDFTHVVVANGTTHPRRLLAAEMDAKPKLLLSSSAYLDDQEAFSEHFAQQYFRRCAEAIRKADPNHLILGCRFGGPPGEAVLRASKKEWVDVVSANNYRPNMRQRMGAYHDATGLPVLNGEFAYHSGHFSNRGKTPEGMAKIGAASLEELFTHPGVVGYTYYRWVQAGAPEDGSKGLSCGLVNIDNKPRQIHVETLRAVHAKADTIAASRRVE